MNATTETIKAWYERRTRAGLTVTALLLAAMLSSCPTAKAQTLNQWGSLVGTWRARVQFGTQPAYLACYTFGPDGTVTEDAFTLEGRPLGSGQGRASLRNARMTINWSSGPIEKATIRLIGINQMQYTITSHTGDPEQVGAIINFQRIPQPQPLEEVVTVGELRTALDGVTRSLQVAEEAVAASTHYTDRIHWSSQKSGCELRIQDLNELLMKAEGGAKIARSELRKLRGTGGGLP
jgi:hypothetical protein